MRVHLLLCHLAERWGTRVDGDVLVPVDLPQKTLGELVCATRPRVSAALRELVARGLVSRTTDGWALHGVPPA
jgi:CRP-like cAMP-binding protein